MTRAVPATPPPDAVAQRAIEAVVVYPAGHLLHLDITLYGAAHFRMTKTAELVLLLRDARTFSVPTGCFLRIISVEGPQVSNLNLWNAHDLSERFFGGKTRALHATHVSTGDRLWSSLPSLRPMATITHDTPDWYGWDEDGAGVHDVIGARCDPYTYSGAR